MTDEYKILQDKIDKIGGFRFTIKGWSVTAVVAATAAASATKSPLAAGTVGLGLAAMVGFFGSCPKSVISVRGAAATARSSDRWPR